MLWTPATVALLLVQVVFAPTFTAQTAPGSDPGVAARIPSLQPNPASAVPSGYFDSLVTFAAEPIALDFLPDGRLIWAERYGRIVYLNTTGPTTILDITAQVYIGSEGGLLGFAVDPDFPSRPYVYIHYSAGISTPKVRISRFTFSDTGSNLLLDPTSEVIGFGDMPKPQIAHFAGAVRFDTQKRLVTSFGEGYVGGCGSQNVSEEAGKLLRMRVDTWTDPGNQTRLVPPDNPFITHPNITRKLTLIEGLRNPFRFDVDTVTGEFFIGDVGYEWEEVNVGRGGENMGWPYFENNTPYALVPCPGHTSIPGNTTKPVYAYQRQQGWPGAAVMGMMVYRGLDWPNNSFPPVMDGTFFLSDFAKGILRVIKKNQSTGQWDRLPGVGPTDWGTGFEHVTDMTVGPDGSVYYVRMWLPSEIRKISYGSNAPLWAGISANRTAGTAPLGVSFASIVAGGSPPYSYSWSFGDGNTSNVANLSHTYAAPGIYTANMTVRDFRGNSSNSNLVNITVSGLGAAISGAPTRGIAPLNVSFDSTVVGGSPPYSYSWAFGDGNASSAANPSHTYPAPGSYTANMTVRDSGGNSSDSNLVNITVSDLGAAISASPASGPAPLNVSFNSTVTGGSPPYSYSWAFGDGNASSAANPSHSYAAPGNYTANLTVRDSGGVSSTSNLVSITVTVGGGQLQVSISANQTVGPAPLAVSFTSTLGGGTPPYTYAWTFGDGGTATTKDPTYIYTTPGTYSAVLAATSVGASANSSPVTITVNSGGVPLAVSISADPMSGPAPLAVAFTGMTLGGTPPYTYSWDFGDGGTAEVQRPPHTFDSAGSYFASLSVADSAGVHAAANPVSISVGAPIDDIPPVIEHIPLVQVEEGTALVIKATVTDDVQVALVKLLYRQGGQTGLKTIEMSAASGDEYQATIPGEDVKPERVEYHIEAADPSSNRARSPSAVPSSQHSVKVTPQPRGGMFGLGAMMNLVLFGVVAAIAVWLTAVTVAKRRRWQTSTPSVRTTGPQLPSNGKRDTTSDKGTGQR